MKRMRVEFELPQEIQEQRKKLIESLKKNPRVIKFLEDNDADPLLVEKYPSRFEEWLTVQNQMSRVDLNQLISKPELQNYHDLEVVNGALIEVVKIHPLLVQYQQKTAYLKNFSINDMPFEFQTLTFDSIDVDHEQQLSFLKALETLQQYLFKEYGKGIYLFGKPGVGKSYLLACLANELARQSKSIAFVNVPALMTRIKNGFDEYRQRRELFESLYNARYLFLDDIGAEQITSYNRDEILLPLLEQRLESKKVTFFSSNYDMNSLEKVYSTDTYGKEDPIRATRIISRLSALCTPVQVNGHDRRLSSLK